jgi:hypothetical protein
VKVLYRNDSILPDEGGRARARSRPAAAVICWFSGASMQAVATGAYRAIELIEQNIKLENTTKAAITDSKKVVEICTQYSHRAMFGIFPTVFFSTLAFACVEPFLFTIFMANVGGAWDNAKKPVEVESKEKGTELHAASVVGDTVGDPFKHTSSGHDPDHQGRRAPDARVACLSFPRGARTPRCGLTRQGTPARIASRPTRPSQKRRLFACGKRQ